MAHADEQFINPLGKYKLNFDELGDELGKGYFGVVYKGIDSEDGTVIAAKKIKYKEEFQEMNDPDVPSKMGKTELDMSKSLQGHKNLVQLLDYVDDGSCHWFIMEFCNGGDLPHYFKNNPVNLDVKIKIIAECASAVAFMHASHPPIVHRDIKPTNVLITRQNYQDVAKIADLGMCKLYDDSATSHRTMTNARMTMMDFLAPEFFTADGGFLRYQPGVDTFSLGILIHVILMYGEQDNEMVPLSDMSRETNKHICYGLELVTAMKMDKPLPVLMGDSNTADPDQQQLVGLIRQMTQYRVEDRADLTVVKSTVVDVYNNRLQNQLIEISNIMSADNNTDLIPLLRTTASKYGHSVQEISDLKLCIDQMREEIKDKQTALETLQVKNCDLTSQVEGLQQTLVGKDELLVSLKDHKQETRDHKQETRDHKQETRDHKQETRDHKQETHDHKQETRDHKQETRDMLEQKLVPKERDLAHSQVEGLQEKLLGKESELEYLKAELRQLKKQLRYKEQGLPNMEAGLAIEQQIYHPAINKEVILHHAENPYKPPHRQLKPDTEQTTVGKLNRKIRSILNKLTPQKYQTLMQQMLNLNIDTEEKLKGVVHIIFEKAIAEPFYSVAYANACKIMATQVTVTSSCDPQEKVTFKKLLLNRCQTEFEKDKSESLDLAKMQKEIDEADSKDKRKLLQEERDLAEAKAQSRSLGNIVFIGQLFKLNMLTERIMHDCIIYLLKSTDEDNLECLCRLMTIVGKLLDHDKAEPLIDQYFIDMEKIIKSRCTSVRTRFMLQDLQELRSCKWKPRRDDNAPKTIGQIHKEAAEEKAKNQALHAQQPPFTPHGGRSGWGGAGGSADEHGWQAVGPVRPNRTDLC